MLSKRLFIGVFIFAILFPVVANAENTTSTSGTTPTLTTKLPPTTAIPGTVKNALGQIQQVRKETRDEFLVKLNKIKDERKKTVVDRINTQISESNTKAINKMTSALTKLTEYLTKLTERSAALKAAGRDTTGLDSFIASAQNAIATATNAVNTQAAKTYTLTITSDSTVKSEVGTTISQFRLDIQGVHKTVVDAKQAVMKALNEVVRLTTKTTTSATGSGIIQ